MTKTNILKFTIILLALILIAGAFYYRQNIQTLLGAKTTTTKYAGVADGSLQDFYQESQNLQSTAPTSTTTISFLAGGDINLSRSVAADIQKSGNVDYPFTGLADLLKTANFNFANLESPVAPTNPIIGGNSMTFGAPAANLQALKDYNFKIMNLANNHAYDQGVPGIDATRSGLDALGITHEGTGDTLDQAWTPAVVDQSGIKICFVGAAYGTNTGGATAAQYVAEVADVARLKSAITTAKTECDFVVATMHAGIEYTRTPNSDQTNFAHEAIDDGADIVIGAHPHWVQNIEKYKGKYIFYSLGNFIFDQDWSQDTQEGLAIKVQISKSLTANPEAPGAATLQDLQGGRQSATLDSIQLIPIIVSNSQPRPANLQESATILGKINETQTILYP